LISLAVISLLRWARVVQNPIALGSAAWFWFGAISFWAPVPAGLRLLELSQASGLFLATLLVGGTATALSPYGYVAVPTQDSRWALRASLGLLALNLGCLAWAWAYRFDIRMGAGLPFLVLNLVRRILGRRAPTSTTVAPQ